MKLQYAGRRRPGERSPPSVRQSRIACEGGPANVYSCGSEHGTSTEPPGRGRRYARSSSLLIADCSANNAGERPSRRTYHASRGHGTEYGAAYSGPWVQPLTHVLWIGGPPGSGKTAVATRIARRHGVRWYGADTRTWAHRDRAIRERHPAALRWEAMTPEERWESATPDEMLALSLHIERGPMIVDDLRRLPTSPLIVAEGSPISPRLVSAGLAARSRSAWLIPSPAFRRKRLAERGLPRGPLELYALVAQVIEREARAQDVPMVLVDDRRGIGATVAAVERLFADALAEGPCAATLAERRGLLREANEAIVAQVHGYYARPWAEGDPDRVARAFLCECGDRSCEAEVEVRVGVAAAAPVLFAGHG